jgi:malonyl CoA-acyl carrier protein transacylase
MIAFPYPGQGAQHVGMIASRRTARQHEERWTKRPGFSRLSASWTPPKRWRRSRMLNWRY